MFAGGAKGPPGGIAPPGEAEDAVEDTAEGASGGTLLRGALRSPLLILLIVGTCYRTCAG